VSGVKGGASIGECPMIENIDDMPINMAPLELKKKKNQL
jgi:hypothetical protein